MSVSRCFDGTFTLMPGYSGNVCIEDKQQNVLYTREFLSEEVANDFIAKYGNSAPNISFLKASLVPVRTDNGIDFAKDLFLPTFFNHALKTKDLSIKILTSAVGISWDLLTFTPRLVAAPFHVYSQSKIPPHPLIKLLKSNHNAKKSIRKGIVIIKIYKNQVNLTQDNTKGDARESKTIISKQIFLKKIPSTESSFLKTEIHSTFYRRIENSERWLVEPLTEKRRITHSSSSL